MIGAGGFYSNGTSFQVEEGMENVTIELTDSMMVLGEVSLNREGNTYNQGFSGWYPSMPSKQPRWYDNCCMEGGS